MKTATLALAVSAGAAFAGASTHTFDLIGLEADCGYAENVGLTSLVHDFGSAGTITNLSFEIKFRSNDPSWASEFAMTVDTDLGSTDILASGYGAPDAPGVFYFTDSIDVSIDSSDGLILLTLWDSFQDLAADPDVSMGYPSWLTVTYIPGPGAMALLAAGGMLACPRRR